MKVVGFHEKLLAYYNEHYGKLSEDDVIDCRSMYDKSCHTRYTWLIAEKDGKTIQLDHRKSTDWSNTGEWFIVMEDSRVTAKEEVNDFFG